MKNFFFVAVATGIFTGTSFTSIAQPNVNIERLNARNTQIGSPKFIEGIEITPDKISNNVVSTDAEKASAGFEELPKTVKSSSILNIEQCNSLQFKYAMLLETEVENVVNFPLFDFIDEWWGTRYRYGGSDKKGIDCSSFTGKLLETVYHQQVPRTARDQYDMCEKVEREDLMEGDLVFFNTRGGISHVGIYLGNNHFVHSSTSSGVTISSLEEDYYNKKFVKGGRIIADK